jgi:hypothetical protein
MQNEVNAVNEVNEVNAVNAAGVEIKSIIQIAKDYAESSAKAAAEQEKADVTARDLSNRCREELGDRWIGINFNSARASKAGDHAASLGMTLDQLKLAIEIKDAFDAAIIKSLKRKGFTEERAKSVKDQRWLEVKRVTIRDLKREEKAKKPKVEPSKSVDAQDAQDAPVDPLTSARRTCAQLIIELNALVDQRGKTSVNEVDLGESIQDALKIQRRLNPK